jgi:hypothetical protein
MEEWLCFSALQYTSFQLYLEPFKSYDSRCLVPSIGLQDIHFHDRYSGYLLHPLSKSHGLKSVIFS